MASGRFGLRGTLLSAAAIIGLAACSPVVGAGEGAGSSVDVPLSELPDNLLWGDLHLHSNLSFDAYSFGTQEFSPQDAYRFARGEEVTSVTGVTAKLKRPLDFLMVSDHAEFLGLMRGISREDPAIAEHGLAQRWAGYVGEGRMGDVVQEFISVTTGSAPAEPLPTAFTQSVWSDVAAAAEEYYEPGKFTTFIGYEWTAMRTGDNLHRVVVFEDGAERAVETLPFSALQSNDPERLWEALAAYERSSGGRVMSIPHNGNLSDGDMFGDRTFSGEAMSKSYRETRLKFEPVAEITQVKGDGEAHPLLSPDDEFADFESWDTTDIGLNPRTKDLAELRRQMAGEYARGALKKGLLYTARDGANPFEFGMIGSTDMHTGLAAAAEDNFYGKFPDSEPSAARLGSDMGGVLWGNATLAASGYVGVWARANTREEIFSALARREVYASTGPRIRLRMFAGWELARTDLDGDDYAEAGYAKGVPMGGILGPEARGGAPRFLLVAAKDPDGAHLDRIQVIKGWRDASGRLHERVYDVALSDGRQVDPAMGKAPAVGSTVNLKNASYTNDIGAAELRAFWLDPDFDPQEQAFYYARVLQIPTPRWTTFDAVRFGLPLPRNVPAEIQDRAYSSPIWYRAGQ